MRASIASFLAVAATAVLIGACGSGPVTGTITELEHEAAQERTCTKYTGTGSNRRCKKWSDSSPECWEVEVTTEDGREADACVPEEEWNRLSLGQTYTIDG